MEARIGGLHKHQLQATPAVDSTKLASFKQHNSQITATLAKGVSGRNTNNTPSYDQNICLHRPRSIKPVD